MTLGTRNVPISDRLLFALIICLWALGAVGGPVAWGALGPPMVPATWGPNSAVHYARYKQLDQICPHDWRRQPAKPLAVGKPICLTHICAPMQRNNTQSGYIFECGNTGLATIPMCGPDGVAHLIRTVLPEDLLRTISVFGGLNADELEQRVKQDLWGTDDVARFLQLKWIGDKARKGSIVCWPQKPGFTPDQFTDIFGYFGALFTNPETIANAVPERVMEYPPGHISKKSYHLLDSRSFRGVTLYSHLQTFLATRSNTGTRALRDMVDRWSGALGRVLLASLLSDAAYDCPKGRQCLKAEDTDCNLPISPDGSLDVIRIFMMTLDLRIPLVISWREAVGSRPVGIWLLIYRIVRYQHVFAPVEDDD
ncbi:hypothetical protein XA68_16446 [Ophiocordyceps unilateralis]|uniref:Uncharacterized protein n=1 Tax=Ophiocordyceps unilateralis TaxID=268505 RepID=A0A2A9PJQ1_OPHUN|nr:hypothetical protein XA68_16446 [Ophiocordyceps unilateralis]